jgi:hypothetical protein
LFPKRDGLIDVRVGITWCENVPIDDGIHALVRGLGDHVIHLGGIAIDIVDITIRALDQIHGATQDIRADIVGEVTDGTRCDARTPAKSPKIMGAPAAKLDWVAARVHQLGTAHFQFSVNGNRSRRNQ